MPSHAVFHERLPNQAQGKYYVDAQCLDCDLCREITPGIFVCDAEHGVAYVTRQPVTHPNTLKLWLRRGKDEVDEHGNILKMADEPYRSFARDFAEAGARCETRLVLAHEQPGRRCLLLCYNKALAYWLAGRLADCPSVEVKHFDGWAKSLGITRQSKGPVGHRAL